MKVLALLLFVFSVHVTEVFSIHCLDCNSYNDPGCGDPFDNKTSLTHVDCDTKRHPMNIDMKSTFCRKITQRIDDKVRVIRSCGYVLGAAKVNQCNRQSLSKGNEVRYCQCDTDFCNSSQVPAYSFFALIVSALMNALMNKCI